MHYLSKDVVDLVGNVRVPRVAAVDRIRPYTRRVHLAARQQNCLASPPVRYRPIVLKNSARILRVSVMTEDSRSVGEAFALNQSFGHPDDLLAGLLNSQPMGFYAPAQLVLDAREHSVVMRPSISPHRLVDHAGEPELSAEALERWNATFAEPLRAIGLGFSRISGIRKAAAERLIAARANAPTATVGGMAMRAQFDDPRRVSARPRANLVI